MIQSSFPTKTCRQLTIVISDVAPNMERLLVQSLDNAYTTVSRRLEVIDRLVVSIFQRSVHARLYRMVWQQKTEARLTYFEEQFGALGDVSGG